MPRWGYALTALLAALLAVYVLRPAEADPGVLVFPADLAAPFTITGDLGDQECDGKRVRVAGLDRPADPEAVRLFLANAGWLRADPARVIADVDAAAARAWGVDGSRRLACGAELRCFGEKDGIGAVHDPNRRRIMLLPAALLDQALRHARRLDRRELLELPAGDPAWIAVDGVRLTGSAGRWDFPMAARPPANGRVQRLLAALREARLETRADAPPATAAPAHELRWADARGGEGRLRLLTAESRAWLAVDGLPPQPLPDPQPWREALAAFASDLIADQASLSEPRLVTIERAGRELLRLELRGLPDAMNRQPWSVAWSGGAEPAAGGAGERVDLALRRLAVSAPAPGPRPVSPDATTITVAYEMSPPLTVVLGAGRAWCDGWLGRIAELPPPLADLRPETFFDPQPCRFDHHRVVKVQRRYPDAAGTDEVYERSGGSWRRTWPREAAPADPAAVERLVRTVVRLHARAVSRASEAERTAAGSLELAVRIAPVPVVRSADDDIGIEDTMRQDRAWRMVGAAGSWRLVDLAAGIAYHLDDDTAEALATPVASRRLLPVAAAMVGAIEFGGAAPFSLSRHGELWRLSRNGREQDADPLRVRRLVRALLALDGGAPAAAAGPALPVVVTTIDGERLAVEFGQGWARTDRGAVAVDPAAWAQVETAPSALLP